MKLARITLHSAFGILVLLGLSGSVVTAAGKTNTPSKASSSSSSSQAVSNTPNEASGGSLQGYASATPLEDGTIVQLVGGVNQVEPATAQDLSAMYGTVVDPHLLSLTVVNPNLQNEAYVATSGTYDVLVSTQNGEIKQGDYITMSSVAGVGMKAGDYDQQPLVFGRAAGDFDGKTNVLETVSLKNTNGSDAGTAEIGLIPVAVNVEKNPNNISTTSNLPPWLTKLGQEIAQKTVSPIKVYLSIAITGLCIIVALVTDYAGVRNAIYAIGRNPLSKKSIFRGLLEVILTGFLILIIGLFAVYLLLKL